MQGAVQRTRMQHIFWLIFTPYKIDLLRHRRGYCHCRRRHHNHRRR